MLPQSTALPLSYKRQRVNEESNFEPIVYKTTALPLSYSPPYDRLYNLIASNNDQLKPVFNKPNNLITRKPNQNRPELDSNQQPND